jgi:cytochrome oxidase assembly protein ShyY1
VRRLFQAPLSCRRGREALNRRRESYSLVRSLIALVLIAGCFLAAQWQYERGIARQDRNDVIEKNTAVASSALNDLVGSPIRNEWKPVTVSGEFDTSNQVLLRNRYFEGQYGFQLLTRFTAIDGKSFWVDCGWVKAGATAMTPPDLPTLPIGLVEISGRLRLDSSLPQGSFFAIPVGNSRGLISEADEESGQKSESFYIDLLGGNQPSLTPKVPAELPELSDGPHLAYALQWIFFAGLVIYGRFLIRREVLPSKELRVEPAGGN